MGTADLRHPPRDVERIVEAQVRRSEIRPAERATRAEPYWPVLTISREFGTSGGTLGKHMAAKLGFSLWDREIVSAIAERLHEKELVIDQLDEHARTVIDDLLSAVLGDKSVSQDYGDELRRLVAAVERAGKAIIVGRGAHMLVEPERALRVRLVCPLSQRIAEYAQRKGISEDSARRIVVEADRERSKFVQRELHGNVSDPCAYDLVINTATYREERADELVLMAYVAKFGHLPEGARTSVEREPISGNLRTL